MVWVLIYEFDWRYVAAVVVMIALYLLFTVRATNWRIQIRRTMNESDSDANTKAIDSLLNYETVKYFGAEARETRRYDKAVAVYEQASVKRRSFAFAQSGKGVRNEVGPGVTICRNIFDLRRGTPSTPPASVKDDVAGAACWNREGRIAGDHGKIDSWFVDRGAKQAVCPRRFQRTCAGSFTGNSRPA